MAFVVDSSVALAWALPDEPSQFDPWLERAETELIVVPAIWPLETSNGVLAAYRRKRLEEIDYEEALTFLSKLQVDVEGAALDSIWRRTSEWARTQNLTTYDASYVELALRRNLPLLTLDGPMRAAARRLGIEAPDA
jgi:predicted nucleic acid-binding protein